MIMVYRRSLSGNFRQFHTVTHWYRPVAELMSHESRSTWRQGVPYVPDGLLYSLQIGEIDDAVPI